MTNFISANQLISLMSTNHLLHSVETLRDFFEKQLSKPVSLTLTQNATRMLSARIRNGVLCIRLHDMFLNAGDDVLQEIIQYLRNKRKEMPLFRQFVRDNRASILSKEPNKLTVKTAGNFHDIRELYDEINNKYFDGAVTAVITWGSRSPRYVVRKRTLGSYGDRSNRIRINPVLDKSNVPRYVVAFVVYHEMLHAAMGVSLQGKRRSVHSKEFRRREKLFEEYEKATAWERGIASKQSLSIKRNSGWLFLFKSFCS